MKDPVRKPGAADHFLQPEVATVAVEAPFDVVLEALIAHQALICSPKKGQLELTRNAFGQERRSQWAAEAEVFQLTGQSCTQIVGPVGQLEALPLARALSIQLATRAVAIESTDDCYGTQALFDRGEIVEIDLWAVRADIEGLFRRMELPLRPELLILEEEMEEGYDEAKYRYSRDGVFSETPDALAKRIGSYLHSAFGRPDGRLGFDGLEASELVGYAVFQLVR